MARKKPTDEPATATDPTEWGIMVLLDLVGSTGQSLAGSDKELRDYQQHRLQHVTARAQRHGFERLDDQADADLLFRPGDDARPLLDLFHDLNHRDPIPPYRHFQPVQRMVAHYQRFAFGPRDAQGRRKQLASNHLTLQFRFEKACPARALLVTSELYQLLRDHAPRDWVQCHEPIPHKLREWSRLTADEIHWLALPGEPLAANVQRSYAQLEEKVRAADALDLPWHPPRAAEKFFGRAREVDEVAALLRQHRRVAVLGAGGLGKTALAREALTVLAPARDLPGLFPGGIYSHDYYQSPGHPAALSSILAQAKLETTPDRDRPAVVTRLLDQPGVLLYLEGCERAEQLFELLNLFTEAAVLLTSRTPDKIGRAHPHDLRPLDEVSAADLLSYHAGQRELPADPAQRRDWLALANRLGCHPLGLLLAGGWLRKRKQTPANFLALLTRDGLAFWDTNLEPKENLRVLFRHSAEAAQAKHPQALTAWFALALHAQGPVPLSALCGALACDETEAEARLGALQDYSLAEPTDLPGATVGQRERAWQLSHALLGEWGRAAWPAWRSAEHRSAGVNPTPVPAEQCSALRSEVIFSAWLDWWEADLDNCFKQQSVPGGPARYQALQPHWDALLLNLEAAEGNDSTRLSLFLNEIAITHQGMGNYSAAEPLCRQALEASERVLVPEHPSTLISVNNLAYLLNSKGDLAAAEPLFRRVLAAHERVLGPEHPATLTSVNNLGSLLKSKGDLAAAEPLYRRGLTACERVLGPEHPDTLIRVNNLASLLKSKGDLAGAEPLFRRALTGSERVLGPEHPDTLISVNNLASLLKSKGDLAGAEPLYRRGLTACERVLGPEHPNTLGSVNNLGSLLYAKGDLAGALPLFERAVQGFLQKLGPDHPNTKVMQENLARVSAQLAKKRR
ncbi:MAG: hypothetical protein RL514_3622 [Verrucomicrobiota bacterium]|jgi:tetratricopeptide (TPR) repeat protein